MFHWKVSGALSCGTVNYYSKCEEWSSKCEKYQSPKHSANSLRLVYVLKVLTLYTWAISLLTPKNPVKKKSKPCKTKLDKSI